MSNTDALSASHTRFKSKASSNIAPGIYDGIFKARTLAELVEAGTKLIEQHCQAESNSIICQLKNKASGRRGQPSPQVCAFFDFWEESISAQLSRGPWFKEPRQELADFIRQVPEEGLVIMNAPMLAGEQLIGSISASFSRNNLDMQQKWQDLAETGVILGFAAAMLDRTRAVDGASADWARYRQIARALAAPGELKDNIKEALAMITEILEAGASSLMLLDKENQELVIEAAYSARGNLSRQERSSIEQGISGWAVREKQAAVVNDIHNDPRFNPLEDMRTGFLTQNVAVVPFKSGEEVIGVLEILNKFAETGFTKEDLEFLNIAALHMGLAVENYHLRQGIREEKERNLKAQEGVRRELARNLHDGTVQLLSTISMNLEHVQRLQQERPADVTAELESVHQLVQKATREARLVLFELRPVILESQGLVAALSSYITQLNESEGQQIDFQTDPVPENLKLNLATTIFMIVQEAINNAKKHSQGEHIWLKLEVSDDTLSVTVRDDGRGFNVEEVYQKYAERGSFGLLNMIERAELIDGKLEVESSPETPGAGTTISLVVPMQFEGE